MALYVAVYDVHPGDRKHFERLLTRISDRRKSESDILYIDAFGSLDALLRTPQKYDIIFIDCALEPDKGQTNIEIARKLKENGVSAPVAGYLGEEMYPDTQCLLSAKSLGNLSFYTKPILTDTLMSILSDAASLKEKRMPRVELRDRENTYFVLPEEILYAKENDYMTDVYLTNGKVITILKNLFAFAADLEGHLHFIILKKAILINLAHVIKKQRLSLVMDDGDIFKIPVLESKKIDMLYEKYKLLR